METSRKTPFLGMLALAAALVATPVKDALAATAKVDLDALVDAVCDVESGGNPYAVGLAGERGLMQIKSGTWSDVTRRVFGEPQPFSRAFDPHMNRRVGRAYLSELVTRVRDARKAPATVPVIAACYNRGPGFMEAAGFSLKSLSREARDYVDRVTNLYDLYSTERAGTIVSDGVPMATFTAPTSAEPDAAETMQIARAADVASTASGTTVTDYVQAVLRRADASQLARQTMPVGWLCAFCVLYGNAALARRLSSHMRSQRTLVARLLRRVSA